MRQVTSATERLTALWDEPDTLTAWFATVDHKKIGKRYLVTAFIFLIIGGIEALIMRLQLAGPNQHLLSPEAYDQLFSMHGITMIFWYASPILAGFGNYLVPLMLGARDLAFPRLNAFTYWTFLLSGLLVYSSIPVGMAPHGGWFAYVPYTGKEFSPNLNMDFYALSLLFLTISTTAGAINFIATIFHHRAPGMTINRMPLLMWSTLTTSFSIVFSLPALTAACLFLELDRNWGTHFFDTAMGGSSLLWQQTFWFFGHPWVYIIFLPATGMISMILPVFSRRPIVGYHFVAFATVMTGVVGFGVWIHHMFAVGMSGMAMSFFSAASMTISIASAVQFFSWIATLWTGRPVLKTPMLFCLGFLFLFLIGGASGVVTAVIPFDWQIHDTYFVVAHLHYVLVGANVFPVFAGFYYWIPKMTGRMLDERLGKWSFWLMFIGFNVGFFPMHIMGLFGMARRVFNYSSDPTLVTTNLLTTIGAFMLAAGILVSIWNFIVSRRSGIKAGPNPWNADSLEWSSESPEGVAVSPDGRWVYITAETSSTVSVIDTKTNTVVANFLVGARPRGAAFSPDGSRAYVTAEIDGTVAVVDVGHHEVIDEIDLGDAKPVGIAVSPNGTKLYIANGHANTVSVIDVAEARVVQTIPVGDRPWGITITKDGNRIFTANGVSNDVSIIDAATSKVIGSIDVGNRPWGVALQ